MILILQVTFHSVFGNKTGPSGMYKAPDLLDNLRYDYGGGSGHLPVVPNIFGTGDQFPKAVFTGTGLETSPAPQFESINTLALNLLYSPTLTCV